MRKSIKCFLGCHDFVILKVVNIPTGGGWGCILKDKICIRNNCNKKINHASSYTDRKKRELEESEYKHNIAKKKWKEETNE